MIVLEFDSIAINLGANVFIQSKSFRIPFQIWLIHLFAEADNFVIKNMGWGLIDLIKFIIYLSL